MKNETKMLSIVLAIVMILTSVSIGVPTFAASKPSATQITSIKAVDNGFKVKWKKKSVTGYQVQYSTSKKFTSKTSKTLKVNKAKTTSKTVKKLKAKKKYYVRVRTYKTVKKKNYYSKWSAKYSVTTKAKKSSSSSSSSAPTIKSISYLDKGYGFKLTWNKVSKAYGYEIQYSTDKNFSDVYDDEGYVFDNMHKDVSKGSTSVNFKVGDKDPAADNTWYVRVRAEKSGGKYSGWSKTVSILTPERKDYLRLMDKAYNEMGIIATDSDFDKLVKIQRWIDYNWYYDRDTVHNDAISVYQLAKYHHNGCNSFAICFNYFANKAGIQSYDIGGCPANKNIEGHHWNYICINGYWYQYDCESDPNPNKSPSGKPYYRTRFYSEKMIEFYILDNKSQIIYNNNIPHGTDYRYYDQQIQNAIGYEYHYN
jgi:hypothetical protein